MQAEQPRDPSVSVQHRPLSQVSILPANLHSLASFGEKSAISGPWSTYISSVDLHGLADVGEKRTLDHVLIVDVMSPPVLLVRGAVVSGKGAFLCCVFVFRLHVRMTFDNSRKSNDTLELDLF